jgi:hypothetical protein
MPEPQPSAPQPSRRLGLYRDRALAGAAVLVVALAIWLILFALGAARTPAQAVARSLGDSFTLQEELVQISLTRVPEAGGEADSPPQKGERYAYFFISNEQLACALLQRGAAGYKVLDINGHLPLTGDGKPGIWMGSAASATEYMVFGLLYDTALSAVEVEGHRAIMVDTGRYRCWYYLGQGSMTINSESVVYK